MDSLSTDVSGLIRSARESLSVQTHSKLAMSTWTTTTSGNKENAKRNFVSHNEDPSSSLALWRTKAHAALSQLRSLQQSASAAEMKAYELQLAVDQAGLTAQTLDDENSKLRALLAEVRDERDRLMLEVRLRRSKMSAAEKRDAVDENDDRRESDHRASVNDLTSQLNTLLIAHEETKAENEALLLKQKTTNEHVHALQETVARLQDENDYFSLYKEEEVLAQEEDVLAVFGEVPVENGENEADSLREQLAETEAELLAVHETLDEERLRSKGLREQCVKQSEELAELRERVRSGNRVERELVALKEVHAETLEKVVTLQLQLDMMTGVED